MSDPRCWKNPLIPADTRVQIADGEIERLRAELAAGREREARLREALITARDHIEMDALEVSHSKDAQVIRSAVRAALAEGAQG